MSITLTDVQAIAPQPWRNNGGRTREIRVWPAHGAWRLRISRADIEADGPFSSFAGVTRRFTVLRGNGVELSFKDRNVVLRAGDDALCFDGGDAPGCRLLDGATEDLNLMAIGGQSLMRRTVSGQTWSENMPMRGLYTTVAGGLQTPLENRQIPAHSLVWDDDAAAGDWTFEPAQASVGGAWWLGFAPAAATSGTP